MPTHVGWANARNASSGIRSWKSMRRLAPAAGRAATRRRLTDFSSEVTTLDNIAAAPLARVTIDGIAEFDRVMGGGVVAGSMVLLGGAPGIGKSTLMLQIAEGLSRQGKGLYISGEESLQQVKDRAHRLGVKAPNLVAGCPRRNSRR